jgi:hypothetical protein
MLTFREKWSQVSSVPKNYTSSPLPQELLLHLVLPLYIINSLEDEGAVVCLLPSTQPTWPQVALCMFGLLLSFLYLPLPPVRFLGWARVGHERLYLRLSSLIIHTKWSHLIILFITLIKCSSWFLPDYLKYIIFLFFSQQTANLRDIILIISVINTSIKLPVLQSQCAEA